MLLRGFFSFLGLLPVEWASAFCGFMVRHIAPHLSRGKRVDRNIALVFPQMEAAERKQLALRMWENIGRMVGEYPHLGKIINNPERIEVVGAQEIAQSLKGHESAFIITAHYGNFEIAGASVKDAGLNHASIYRPVNNPYVDRLLANMRLICSPAGMIAKGDADPRNLIRKLKSGISLAMLVDQREGRGIKVPFLGHDAMTVHAPGLIARRTNIPIIVGRAKRLDGVKFRVEGCLVPYEMTDDREGDVRNITIKINDILSDWIRESPEQWFWFHRRWE